MSNENHPQQDFGIWPVYTVFYLESMSTVTHAAMSAQTDFQHIMEEMKSGNFDIKTNCLSTCRSLQRRLAL